MHKKNRRVMFFLMATALTLLSFAILYTGCGGGSGGSGGGTNPTSSPTSATGSIKGNVLDVYGQPLADAQVTLDFYDKNKTEKASTVTDSNGDYSFDDVSSGSHQITVYKNNYSATSQVTVTSGSTSTSDMQVEPSGTIAGSVKSESTGNPISAATVEIIFDDTLTLTTSSDSSGLFEFLYIKQGTHTIKAEKSGYQSKSQSVTVTAGQTTNTAIKLSVSSSPTPTPTPTATATTSPTPTPTATATTSPTPTPTSTSDYSTVEESTTISGYTFTITRPNATGEFPGIMVLNGMDAATLAKKGFFVLSGYMPDTTVASAAIDAMKANSHCSDKVGVTGFSADAAMAMVIAANTKKIGAVVEMNGLLVPENNIDLSTDMPNPVFFITGENDTLASPTDTTAMYNKLISGGQPGELYIVPGEGHGYSTSAMATITAKAIVFFNKYLR
ncbi:MAG: carboxypeptidase regulatory-like domain-containing protein [Firmicutes bacterium]|nr:carboxypeptidase regulatory-like domain-containing protein [Bacillota bacterium]